MSESNAQPSTCKIEALTVELISFVKNEFYCYIKKLEFYYFCFIVITIEPTIANKSIKLVIINHIL